MSSVDYGNRLSTDLGKIYFKWNDEIDDFEKFRVISKNKDGYKIAWLKPDSYHIPNTKDLTLRSFAEDISEDILKFKDSFETISAEKFLEMRKEYNLLQSDGILAVTNILAATTKDGREVKDVCYVFFKNRDSGAPDPRYISVIARQALSDIYNLQLFDNDVVGFSVTPETLPAKLTMTKILETDKVYGSRLYHVYKTDSEIDLGILTTNEDTDKIFKDLYTNRLNTRCSEKDFDATQYPTNLDGYCINSFRFICDGPFMYDMRASLGIVKAPEDIVFTDHGSLSKDDMLTLAVVYGGIKIIKTTVIKFDYDIDLSTLHTKYLLVMDFYDNLWLVGYTEDPAEYLKVSQNLSDDDADNIGAKLRKIAKAYK